MIFLLCITLTLLVVLSLSFFLLFKYNYSTIRGRMFAPILPAIQALTSYNNIYRSLSLLITIVDFPLIVTLHGGNVGPMRKSDSYNSFTTSREV